MLDICIKHSPLWDLFKVLTLHQNMRTGPGQEEFSDWLLQLGEGRLPTNDEEQIEVPEQCLVAGDLVDEMFGQSMSFDDVYYRYCKSVILSPKNASTLDINWRVLARLSPRQSFTLLLPFLFYTTSNIFSKIFATFADVEATTYWSVDEPCTEHGEDPTLYPAEFLNSLTPSGMPRHELRLKVGAIVILLRNISPKNGLRNGTRMIVLECLPNVLKCELLTGSKKGTIQFISRITLKPAENDFLPFDFKRRQFPVRLAFAMTINKAQVLLSALHCFTYITTFATQQTHRSLSKPPKVHFYICTLLLCRVRRWTRSECGCRSPFSVTATCTSPAVALAPSTR